MNITSTLRSEIEREIFDYQTLTHALRRYDKPRDKITRLLNSGDILRLKKGLYCFGEGLRRDPVSREQLANLLYGPSYISLEYALAHHGLIPERVETITSVTTGRSRIFTTPIGRFSYRMLGWARYRVGIMLSGEQGGQFLLASPEKALADKVWTDRRFNGRTISGFGPYLTEDLRISPESLAGLDRASMARIAERYDSRKIGNLLRFLNGLGGSADA